MAKATDWFQWMGTDKVKPDLKVYSSIIHGFAQQADVDEAERWFKKMQDAGVQVDTAAVNAVINACAQAHKPGRASWWIKTNSTIPYRYELK